MDDAGQGLVDDLEKKYCPPLDPALFTAIVSDYDLSDSDNIQQLRDTLDQLKVSAAEQEHLIFDPSATSGGTNQLSDGDFASDPSPSQNGTQQSLETDITSLESNLSSLDLDYNEGEWRDSGPGTGLERTLGQSSPNKAHMRGLERMTAQDKITYLKEMFSSVDHYTITHTLRKCGEDVDRSMDVLLNIAFFENQNGEDKDEKVSIPRGVEGFTASSSNAGRGRRKGKNKRNTSQQQRLRPLNSSRSSSQSDGVGSENKWEKGKKDVDYICSRTSLSAKVVSSTYHLNGASLPATIHSFASSEAEKVSDDMLAQPVMVTQIAELSQDFNTIPPTKLAGLLILSRNSISAAKELAEVMVSNPVLLSPNIVPANTRPNPQAIDTPIRRTPNSISTPTPTRSRTMDYSTARNIADSHMLAGQSAFTKASAAYRRGKSDHLMGGAAGYYSALGREHLETAKRESAMAADILVNSQSTSRQLDLHGVSVQDAVRIASAKVSEWWESLGDSKYVLGGANTAREGYHIITGVGRHSRDGTSRLGPAVARMLAREGWKVEVGRGNLSVTGLARHK
ncbi:hypothetical protein FQN54_001566 [Arachnomyces sp. PD_36]|nr:hypothetical protein FQN54_001566 [Arachnomyces sp. PD_36]